MIADEKGDIPPIDLMVTGRFLHLMNNAWYLDDAGKIRRVAIRTTELGEQAPALYRLCRAGLMHYFKGYYSTIIEFTLTDDGLRVLGHLDSNGDSVADAIHYALADVPPAPQRDDSEFLKGCGKDEAIGRGALE